ncbi:MAG TPA: hypothetical protein VG944_18330 [Fimbriimonas sp.]|nr:hypothetical protein [Fimbriimonas sp.]
MKKNQPLGARLALSAVPFQPSRREFVVGIGALAASAYLAGCGGGGGGRGSSHQPVNVDRPPLAPAFSDRVEQYSKMTDNLGSIWDGSSASIANLADFSSKLSHGMVRSIDPNTALMLEATWYALSGLKVGYERLANGLLAQDDQGYVAGSVDSDYDLQTNEGLANPQFLAAIMLQTYAAFRVTGGVARMLQIAGAETMQAWIAAQNSDAAKLIAYGIFADVYNSWLDTIQSTLGTPSLASGKLDLSAGVTAAKAVTNSAAVTAHVELLPLGFGYRTGAAAGPPKDADAVGSPAGNFAMSFLGSLSKVLLTANGSLSKDFPTLVAGLTPKYDLKSRLGSTGLFATINSAAGSAAAAQTLANTLVANLFSAGLPAADKSVAKYTTNLAAGGYGLIVSFANVILSDHSLVGTAIAGDQALALLNNEIDLIEASGTRAQKAILAGLECDIETLQATHLYSGSSVLVRSIPITNPGTAETDLIRSQTLRTDSCLMYPQADAGWSGKPSDGTISLFRKILAGLEMTAVPRTFNNAEVSGAGLIYDLIFRYADLLKPDVLTSGQFIFIVSDFARILRRSPGITNAQLPAVSGAVLMCSAPGLAPNRWPPVDLKTATGLEPLLPLSTLVPGVPIHVS